MACLLPAAHGAMALLRHLLPSARECACQFFSQSDLHGTESVRQLQPLGTSPPQSLAFRALTGSPRGGRELLALEGPRRIEPQLGSHSISQVMESTLRSRSFRFPTKHGHPLAKCTDRSGDTTHPSHPAIVCSSCRFPYTISADKACSIQDIGAGFAFSEPGMRVGLFCLLGYTAKLVSCFARIGLLVTPRDTTSPWQSDFSSPDHTKHCRLLLLASPGCILASNLVSSLGLPFQHPSECKPPEAEVGKQNWQ